MISNVILNNTQKLTQKLIQSSQKYHEIKLKSHYVPLSSFEKLKSELIVIHFNLDVVFIKRFMNLGIRKNCLISFLGKCSNSIIIKVNDTKIAISQNLADQIIVYGIQ